MCGSIFAPISCEFQTPTLCRQQDFLLILLYDLSISGEFSQETSEKFFLDKRVEFVIEFPTFPVTFTSIDG